MFKNCKTNKTIKANNDDIIYIKKSWTIENEKVYDYIIYNPPVRYNKTSNIFNGKLTYIYFTKNQQDGILVKNTNSLSVDDFKLSVNNSCILVKINKNESESDVPLVDITTSINLYLNVVYNTNTLKLKDLYNLLGDKLFIDVNNIYAITHKAQVVTMQNGQFASCINCLICNEKSVETQPDKAC